MSTPLSPLSSPARDVKCRVLCWLIFLGCAVPATVLAEETSPSPDPASAALTPPPVRVSPEPAWPKKAECDAGATAEQVHAHMWYLYTSAKYKEAEQYLTAVGTTCPKIAACHLIRIYNMARVKFGEEYADKRIYQIGDTCLNPKPSSLDSGTLSEIQAIYDNTQGRTMFKRDIERKHRMAPRLKVAGPTMIGAGVVTWALSGLFIGLSVGRYSLAHNCTSPLGVLNDPCIVDPRPFYGVGLPLGAALIGGGIAAVIFGMRYERLLPAKSANP